jgi:excisionase family DNA binding protein
MSEKLQPAQEPPESGQADGRTNAQDALTVHLSIDEAAVLLDTTPRNVRRWIAEGKLEGFKDPKGGRGRVVSAASAQMLLEERNSEPGDEKTAQRTDGRTDKGEKSNVRPSVHDGESTALIEQLRGEVEFLRARNAELNAVMMQQARALEASAEAMEKRPALPAPVSVEGLAVGRAETPLNVPKSPAPASETSRERKAPTNPLKAKRRPRPFWMVLLGIRTKD